MLDDAISKAEQVIKDAGGTVEGVSPKVIHISGSYSKDVFEAIEWLMFEHDYELNARQ